MMAQLGDYLAQMVDQYGYLGFGLRFMAGLIVFGLLRKVFSWFKTIGFILLGGLFVFRYGLAGDFWETILKYVAGS